METENQEVELPAQRQSFSTKFYRGFPRFMAILATFGFFWLWLMIIVIFRRATEGESVVRSLRDLTPLGPLTSYALSHHWHLTLSQAFVVSPWWTLFGVFIFAPMTEEAIFRALPIRKCVENGEIKDWWPIIVWSFIVFGFFHTLGPDGVMLQGVGGFMLAMLFVRNGPSQKVSYFSCVLAHAMYNFSVSIAQLYLAAKAG